MARRDNIIFSMEVKLEMQTKAMYPQNMRNELKQKSMHFFISDKGRKNTR
jgi:hypothetical protein